MKAGGGAKAEKAERSSAIGTGERAGGATREAGADIFPHALVTAAKTFTTRPEIVGRVLIALVAGNKAEHSSAITTGAPREKLTDVERYIIAECEAEIADRRARREAATARKRAQRKGGL